MKKIKIAPLIKDTYLAVIKNSVDSKSFRNYYAKVNGKRKDIMNKGELSCAFYVSAILKMFNLISQMHGTVDSTIKDMKENKWKETEKPNMGDIIVWEKLDFGKEQHRHIGFYIGNKKAISNNFILRHPLIHSWDFNKKRKIELILTRKIS